MNLLTWPELAVHEKQQGGYWLYPCADRVCCTIR